MDKTHFTCPHCHGQIKVIPQRSATATIARTLEHVAPAAPRGYVRSLFWFLRGNKPVENTPSPGAREIVLRIEGWSDDRSQAWFGEFRGNVEDLKLAARLHLAGVNWSRPQFCKYGFSQDRYNQLTDQLKRLNMCHVTSANKTILTPRAYALLRAVLRIP